MTMHPRKKKRAARQTGLVYTIKIGNARIRDTFILIKIFTTFAKKFTVKVSDKQTEIIWQQN
jgi:hypothetical protein